jgi:hypothetical protein
MSTSEQPLIFISYSREDERAVKELVRGIESAHHRVWIDQDLMGGEQWWNVILDRIAAADVFVFALSDSSIMSEPCRVELQWASDLGMPILQIKVGSIRNIHAIPRPENQIVDGMHPDAGFAVVSAIDSMRHLPRQPSDLQPSRPPIPHAYLLRLSREIESDDLSPSAQATIIDELRRALERERDTGVQGRIRKVLHEMAARPYITRHAADDIAGILGRRTQQSVEMGLAATLLIAGAICDAVNTVIALSVNAEFGVTSGTEVVRSLLFIAADAVIVVSAMHLRTGARWARSAAICLALGIVGVDFIFLPLTIEGISEDKSGVGVLLLLLLVASQALLLAGATLVYRRSSTAHVGGRFTGRSV